MDLRVGGVIELLGHEVVRVLLAKLLGGEHGPRHALDGRRKDELGTETLRQLAPLHAVVVRHGQNQLVALRRRDHGQADTGVATGRLHDRASRLQDAAALRVLDHRKGDAVLDAARGVE